PNFIVINVVKGTCQYHYLLDSPVYEHQLDLFKDVRNILISYLPDGRDWSCPDINRSPFLTVGKRDAQDNKSGLVQADYALVVAHDDSAKPWSIADLIGSFPRNVQTDERRVG